MSFLRIQNLYKTFDRVVAVNRINLEIKEGEFFTLLGSSGCGKTTTLRMIGGLEKPDGGAIYLADRCLVSDAQKLFVKPEKRDMGMVFQSYALWPHMTVFENVAYPLKLRGIRGAQAEKKVAEVLALVGLAGLEERQAPALSGGQQQRVALARALGLFAESSCCSTNRSATWTRSYARRCGASLKRCSSASTSRLFS